MASGMLRRGRRNASVRTQGVSSATKARMPSSAAVRRWMLVLIPETLCIACGIARPASRKKSTSGIPASQLGGV